MSFKTITAVLAAAVATSGTFTAAYPTGTTKGDFYFGWNHKLSIVGMGGPFVAPVDFTLSLGASTVTVTWLGTTTIPVGSTYTLELDQVGRTGDRVPLRNDSPLPLPGFNVYIKPLYISLGTPATSDDDGICAAQAVSGAGSATINGALASGGAVTMDVPRTLTYKSSNAGDTTQTVTVTGKRAGVTVTETKTLNGTTAVPGKKAFDSVSAVTVSASMTGNLTVGTADLLGLPVYLPSDCFVAAEIVDGVALPRNVSKVRVPYFINETDLLAPTAADVVCPVAGTITDHRTMVQKTITTGGTITPKIGTTALTGGVATIANSATKGTAGTSTAITGANTVAVGDRIQILPASFASAGAVNGYIEITPTTAVNGTLAVADAATATATTGDTRGTYSPTSAPNSSRSYALILMVPDDGAGGATQA